MYLPKWVGSVTEWEPLRNADSASHMNNTFCGVFLLNLTRFEITIYWPSSVADSKQGQIVSCVNEIESSSAEAQIRHSQYQTRQRRSHCCHPLCVSFNRDTVLAMPLAQAGLVRPDNNVAAPLGPAVWAHGRCLLLPAAFSSYLNGIFLKVSPFSQEACREHELQRTKIT